MPWWRRSLIPGKGRTFLTVVLTYEVAALWSDHLPTISEEVKRHPEFGVVILAALAHHFYLEGDTP